MAFTKPILALLTLLAFISHSTESLKIVQSRAVSTEVEFSRNSPKSVSKCGGILTSPTGEIFKLENYGTSERCAWVIGVPGAVGYHISITKLSSSTNRPNGTQELHLTGIASWDTTGQQREPILTTYKPSSIRHFTIENSNIVVVTFTLLNSVQAGGFELKYGAIMTGNITATSPLSTHYTFDLPLFHLKHPESRSTYDNNELSAFIFQPLNSTTFNTRGNHRVGYRLNGLENTGCADQLFYYKFHKHYPPNITEWSYAGDICGDVTDQEMLHNDMSMLLFRSDATITNSGFWLGYFTC